MTERTSSTPPGAPPLVAPRASRCAAVKYVAARRRVWIYFTYELTATQLQERVAAYGIENHAGTPVYVHAKVCIVDDVWMIVGSDNLNLRSWTNDSELSCAIVNGLRALHRAIERLDSLERHLQRTSRPIPSRSKEHR